MTLHRRTFISAAAAALALPALPARARPALAADFDANVADAPLLRAFKGVTEANASRSAEAPLLRGRWPAGLRGRFLRNGPALFERGGERYHHWFDGDGLAQQFTLADGGVTHRARLVQTAKLRAESAAGRFALPAFGTSVERPLPMSGSDSVNTANTNLIEHGGRLLALWEGGSAYALDRGDLRTEGPVAWRADLRGVPFSAHPKVDGAGHLWNIGNAGEKLVLWQIDAQGRLVQVQIGEHPLPFAMTHDMAVTERWVVVPVPPVRLRFEQTHPGPRPFVMEAGEPLRVLVMDKTDIRRRRVFELPPQMVFHVGNAHEEADGSIVLSYVGAPDAGFLDHDAVQLMRGQMPLSAAPSSICIARLSMTSGKAQLQTFDDLVEFPRIHPAWVARPARWLTSIGSWSTAAGSSMLHGVQVLDLQSGRRERFDYGRDVIAEEHIVVPKPGRGGERDAWLLGLVYDGARQRTVLNLLDMAAVADGPIAQAELPYAMPPGFHGNFVAG